MLYRSPAWLAVFGLVAHLGSMLVPAIFHLLAMAKVLDFCSVGRYTIASLQGPVMILPESSTLPHFSSLTFCQRLRRTLGIRPKMAPRNSARDRFLPRYSRKGSTCRVLCDFVEILYC